MDIYDSRYFSINKRLLTIIGLWPYDNPHRKIVRTLWLAIFLILDAPHVCAIIVHKDDPEMVMEGFAVQVFILGVWFKLLTIALAEDKMMILYENIVKNWYFIVDKTEKEILQKYSEDGQFLTIGYLAYLAIGCVSFCMLPLVPLILDIIYPLDQKRPYIYLANGEFFIEDKDPYYWFFYVWDSVTVTIVTLTAVAIDTMYSTCVKHCLGLFAIIRYRLRGPYRSVHADLLNEHVHLTYEKMVDIVELHQKMLNFTKIMENSYNVCFLVLILIHLVGLPLVSVLVLKYINIPINVLRALVLFMTLTVHQFYLSWPGQELASYSGDLLIDSYFNEWHASTPETKKLLRFFALRCTKSCSLTAGGIMEMNMENFSMIMRTAISYITVFASFRAK